MNTILTVGFKEFRDRLRSGWVLACIVIWLAVILMTSLLGLIQIGHIGVQGYERTTISLLNLVQYFVPLLGLLVGHDLVVRERQDRTLHLILASGAGRIEVVIGKFLGAALTVAVPLVAGFLAAGGLIGKAAHDAAFGSFLKLAGSGLALGIVFSGVGLLLSMLARSHVQALVCALVTWGMAVFAFDLIALGLMVSSKAVQASNEIELVCDATHVNSQADIHAAFDEKPGQRAQSRASGGTYLWLWLNPVDVFRVMNLPKSISVPLPLAASLLCMAGWAALAVGAAAWRFRRIDL